MVRTKEYKRAKYRIVISHFPMVMGQDWKDEHMWHGWTDAINKFLPVLNEAKVDLMVSGHTHRTFYHPIKSDGNNFPILEQGYDSAVRLDLHQGHIAFKVVDRNGKVVMER